MISARKRSNIVPLSIDPRAQNALKYRGEEHCALIKSMAHKGEFPEQWCAQLGIALSTMFNWAARHPEFDEACRVAWTALSAFWTRELIEATRGNSRDTKILLELLRRRFPDTWGVNAKNTVGHFISCVGAANSAISNTPDFSAMTIDELEAELTALRSGSGSDKGKTSPD